MTAVQGIAPAPFQVHSVHFDFPGGQAIRLRNHATDLVLGLTPEWDTSGRNELAAYVRGTNETLRRRWVTRLPFDPPTCRAAGSAC